MRVNKFVYVAIILIAFFIPYGLAKAGGYWSTSGKFDGTGTPIVATGRDTAEIKGWMTFDDISQGYKVSIDEIVTAFDLPKEEVSPDKTLNKMESTSFSVTKLRQWLDERRSSSP